MRRVDVTYMFHVPINIIHHIIVWQLRYTSSDCKKAFKKLQQVNERDRHEFVHLLLSDQYKLALCKRNCALFMLISFSIFPTLYHLRYKELYS